MSRQVYFEHDDKRGSSTSYYRQPMGRQRKYKDYAPRGFPSGKSRLIDPDGDVDMGGPPSTDRRYNPYAPKNHNNNRKKHRKQTGTRRNRGGPSDNANDLFTWHRITIPFGRKAGKTYIYKAISSLCKGPFIPFNFQFTGNAAEFYIENHSTAKEIRDLHRRITTPDGFKMLVQTSRCPAPNVSFDAETMETLKKIMSSRYDPMTLCLNLVKFHNDESMTALGLYLPLNKPPVLSAVAKIIKENIPQLETLDLTDNKMIGLESLSIITPVCKAMKSLILRNNKLRNISSLDALKGLDLVDLVLDGNPLCDDFKDKASYISAARDRFPKLMNLDGTVLPATIGFDLGTEKLPVSKKSFFAADDVKEMVIQFLDLYYTIYDSGDRLKLLDAYHDQAYFSLCLAKHSSKSGKGGLGAYNFDNRNLLIVEDYNRRFKLLKQGKLSIVNALTELPQTMHDPTSFSIDIFHISPNLMSFSVIGVFKEVGADINNAILKTFSRTYVVAPQGTGLVITNETLFISHSSTDQQSKAFKVPAPTPSPSPAPAEEKSTNEKQMMVIELSKQTGMNLDFSTKCLEENDWDFQRAVAVFMKFQSEGKLPPAAFITL